ncbi:MAG: FAD binding domain-containing protein [Desulfohalobiaceae bacterium]
MYAPFSYARPGSLEDVLTLLEKDKAHVHAGGTDLLSCLRDHVFEVDTVVSISSLKDLRGIRQTADGGLSIGSMTTITELAENPLVREHAPGLSQAASEVASPQLRNQGTLGGNLCQKPRCWYYRGEFHCLRKGGQTCFAVNGENQFHCIFGGSSCYIVHPSDTAPVLVALGGRVRIRGRNGTRTIAVESFLVPPAEDPRKETVLEPGEVVTEILVPQTPPSMHSSYRKIRARRSWDFALAGVALALDLDGDRVRTGRVVCSGVAPVPWRSREAEQVLTGSRLDDATIAEAAAAAVEPAQPMTQNRYKVDLLRGAIAEELAAVSN